MELKKIHISDIGKVVTGKTPRTSIVENYGGDIPFLTPSDDLSYKSVPKTGKTLTEQGLNEVKNCLLPPHSVCVSCIGTDLGKVVMTSEPTITNQQFNSIIPNRRFDADFVYYLMTLVGKELNYLSKTSTAVPIINKSSFSNYEVEVPDLETQEKIASILSSLDSKIELNRRINDNLEQQAQAWLNELLDRYANSTTVLIHEIAEINPKRNLSKGTSAKCIEMANLPTTGSFPNGWIEKEYNGGMKFCNGDTLIARITPCLENGKTAFINFLDKNEIAYGSTEYIVISAKSNYSSSFFYFLARNHDFVDYAVKNMNGSSGRQRVSGDTISKYRIPVIPREKLESFTNHAEIALKTIKNNSLQNMRLSMTRDALLPKLMSGELKVNDLNS
ncbi:restriction endonuclease subunit S [Bacteroides intestinalis]|uniref:restriction endonuclease subunit S n=1 Tax=Bacteroides intestinalis TaxID=329854 RepID=UPI000E43AF01|nr:restriction endonuclease subunit S [Bacteroides intestinalis]RGK26288.1 restriction endonuclease subunit S [Bacteroides intestinalis]